MLLPTDWLLYLSSCQVCSRRSCPTKSKKKTQSSVFFFYVNLSVIPFFLLVLFEKNCSHFIGKVKHRTVTKSEAEIGFYLNPQLGVKGLQRLLTRKILKINIFALLKTSSKRETTLFECWVGTQIVRVVQVGHLMSIFLSHVKFSWSWLMTIDLLGLIMYYLVPANY